MLRVPVILSGAALLAAAIAPLSAVAQHRSAAQRAPAAAPLPEPPPPYAVFADLVLAAPVIVDAAIRGATRIKGPEALNVPQGFARLYVEADVQALIRSSAPLPPRIGYVLDVPIDARGKLPNLRKFRVLLFARAVAGATGQIQLVRPDAQRAWTPGADELTRRITTETIAVDAPPVVTGIGNAFHTPGNLPGEGETQIFLTTADSRPVSLNITRRPGEERRWSLSLSDVVEQAAPPPPGDTLLWYRLACALPAALPNMGQDGENAAVARDDYQFVIESLGRCDRGPTR
ncbi:hypothetical protein [Sphingomonas sp. ERG5]|uniref:hypothetical protein n=1 Tax=Sphingomonas sp. ERG5 TaxID=1381597 RepID=UPI00054BE525|nr:hypothetical protein [Sphingomonas sp. ERG5]